ncbi:MAG TPA: oligogalacturonate lyase family protein [Verrucomicrobiae bacterium]|nr:oligogalacturonate lyase family protein [Verrucomicrobiae bacterium]
MRLRFVSIACCLLVPVVNAAEEPPREWIDRDTGHRVVRLSTEPGSESLYFHQNAFTASGDKMVMTTPGGISTVNLQNREIALVVPDTRFSTNQSGIIVGRKTRQVFYVKREGDAATVYCTHLDTKITRRVGNVPGTGRGSMLAINADETLLAGSFVERPPQSDAERDAMFRRPDEGKGTWMLRRLRARLPMQMFVMNVSDGASRTFHSSTDWLNHVQMSPMDPQLILFCHEGPWHLLDRLWTIRADGTGLKAIHPRTMQMEIAGHEFFSADGKTIWYDLQTPRGQVFWLAGYEIETGARTWYQLQRDEWSVHYNISPDGKLFAGDGGHEGSVAKAQDGKWIYLFRPEMTAIPNGPLSEDRKLIQTGVFRSERLVNMKNHNYALEPNVQFTPDGKWIAFRANLFGASHSFIVEVAKAGR